VLFYYVFESVGREWVQKKRLYKYNYYRSIVEATDELKVEGSRSMSYSTLPIVSCLL